MDKSLARVITDLYNTEWANLSQADAEKMVIEIDDRLRTSPEYKIASSSTLEFIGRSVNDVIQTYGLFSGLKNAEYSHQHDDGCGCDDDGAEVDSILYSQYAEPTPEEVAAWREFMVENNKALIEEVVTPAPVQDVDIQRVITERDTFLKNITDLMKIQYKQSYAVAKLATELLDQSLKSLEQLDKIENAIFDYKSSISDTENPHFEQLLSVLMPDTYKQLKGTAE